MGPNDVSCRLGLGMYFLLITNVIPIIDFSESTATRWHAMMGGYHESKRHVMSFGPRFVLYVIL